MSTLTAPGNKTWTYTYNGIGQPTQVAIPNGMTTAYTYDNRNRLTKIEHKDGATALDSFNYTLDAQGNITRTAQVVWGLGSGVWDLGVTGNAALGAGRRCALWYFCGNHK
ncbi:MAG: RHS repeat protein [Candidatus Hydrogenedentes bacterium]|nr:RHS repeat protein [Candidatus Hydrogenedentota bacterium]